MITWHGGHGPGWHAKGHVCPQPLSRTREHGLAHECGVARRGGFGSGVELQKHLRGEIIDSKSCRWAGRYDSHTSTQKEHPLSSLDTRDIANHPSDLPRPELSRRQQHL